jgi:hypothetical protein
MYCVDRESSSRNSNLTEVFLPRGLLLSRSHISTVNVSIPFVILENLLHFANSIFIINTTGPPNVSV